MSVHGHRRSAWLIQGRRRLRAAPRTTGENRPPSVDQREVVGRQRTGGACRRAAGELVLRAAVRAHHRVAGARVRRMSIIFARHRWWRSCRHRRQFSLRPAYAPGSRRSLVVNSSAARRAQQRHLARMGSDCAAAPMPATGCSASKRNFVVGLSGQSCFLFERVVLAWGRSGLLERMVACVSKGFAGHEPVRSEALEVQRWRREQVRARRGGLSMDEGACARKCPPGCGLDSLP